MVQVKSSIGFRARLLLFKATESYFSKSCLLKMPFRVLAKQTPLPAFTRASIEYVALPVICSRMGLLLED